MMITKILLMNYLSWPVKMNDLFYSNTLTLKEKAKLIKKDIIKHMMSLGVDVNSKNYKIAIGKVEKKESILFILPPFNSDKLYQDEEALYLLNILNLRNITNYIIMYSQPFKQCSRKSIRNFSIWVQRLTYIFDPKTIVLVGEQASFSFFTKVKLLENHRGQIVEQYNNKNIILIGAYKDVSKEQKKDNEYNQSVIDKDWSLIC